MKRITTILMLLLGWHLSIAQSTSDTLRVGYASAPPFIIESEDGELNGLNIWLWEKVARELNIEYELVRMGFSEMLEGLRDNSIDLSINPLTITSERNEGFLFTHSFYVANSTIVTGNVPVWQRLSDFGKAFFNRHFLTGMCVLLFVIIFFGVVAWLFERKQNPEQFRPGWKGLWDGIWWSVVTMTTVGYGDKTTKSRGGKLVALLWMFSGILFISGLTASVASSLTINELTTNPEHFSDFKLHTVGSIRNSSASNYLDMNFFQDVQLYDNILSGLNDLEQEKIAAFIYDEPILRYRLKQHEEKFPRLQLHNIKFDLQLYAFGFSKKRRDTEEAVSQVILEITESFDWQMILNNFGLIDAAAAH